MTIDDRSLLGAGVGPLVALVAATALVPFRAQVGNVNVALVLASIVVAAGSFGRRPAGVSTALVAALSFAFFHTQPYDTLRVEAFDDVLTALLLLFLGTSVGELSELLHRTRRRRSHMGEVQRLHRIASRASLGETAEDLILQVCAELIELLSLRDCWWEPAPFMADLPLLHPDGTLTPAVYRWSGDGFELPDGGAALLVDVGGVTVGRFVLATSSGVSVDIERRLVASALADQVRVVLAARSA